MLSASQILTLFTLLCMPSNSRSNVLTRLPVSTDSDDSSEAPHVWPVPLTDATHSCGNGCIYLKVSELARKVSIESLTVASIYFYEHGEPTEWSVFHENQEQYEIYTVNRHMRRHHTITQFTVESEEEYNTNWRSANILHKIKSWHAADDDSAEYLVLRKIGDTDDSNSRFAFGSNAQPQPFILIGVPPSEDPDRPTPRQRIRRNASTTSQLCAENPSDSDPCCVSQKHVDLDQFNDITGNWWISPRNFNMTYCKGICRTELNYYYKVLRLYSDSMQSSCGPASFVDFEIWISLGGNVTKSYLKYFQAVACQCL